MNILNPNPLILPLQYGIGCDLSLSANQVDERVLIAQVNSGLANTAQGRTIT